MENRRITLAAPPDEGAPIFGDRIAAIRKRRELSQRQLAAAIRVSQPRISAWERRRGWPKPDQLLRLAAGLAVPVENLCLPLGRAEEPCPVA